MKIKNYAMIWFAALTIFVACTDGDDDNNGMGKLVVQITDAPFPHDLVAEANVTIFKVDARMAEGEADMESEEGRRFRRGRFSFHNPNGRGN